MDLPGTAGTASDEQSPFYETGTRSKRVNFQGAARKATVFCYPSLGDIHETVEGMPEETVREQVLKACTAKTSVSSPVMKGIVSKHKNCQPSSHERLIADSTPNDATGPSDGEFGSIHLITHLYGRMP